MTASTRRELRSAATSTSTTAIGLIRALTDARPIKPTSTRCLSARRPNPGRGSTYRRGNPVQTTAATSQIPFVVVLGSGPDRIERNGNVLLTHAEEPAHADDQRGDLAVAVDQHVHDLADLVVGRIVDVVL